MIDFTKEELIMILLDFESLNPNPTQKVRSTINKIKLMIDSYCEHDGDIGKDYPAEKCMKCGA